MKNFPPGSSSAGRARDVCAVLEKEGGETARDDPGRSAQVMRSRAVVSACVVTRQAAGSGPS